MSLPTLYQYYTHDGITNGLSANQPNFTLNHKNITIYSGALHYFRVPPQYWHDRLRKMRAAGLNTVETYVPWNLHEPIDGHFDFGQGGTDFEEFLDISTFLKAAQEEDLFVIVRPGPYICAEWDFGGLPSWLLRKKDLKVRTSDPNFIALVRRYYQALFALLAPLQFTRNGSIIALQIENEYGNTKNLDVQYLEQLKQTMLDDGIVELLFTSDTPSNGFSGTLPGVLATANFQQDPQTELTLLQKYQPGKPLMVMEYWTGWFDHWTERHHTRTVQDFADVLEQILKLNSSVNMYMFHGGTNWGFLNGANLKSDTSIDNSTYQPDTTSYDYDAPLNENGDYTDKFYAVKRILEEHNTVNTLLPALPEITPRAAYGSIKIDSTLTLNQLVNQALVKVNSKKPTPMELLDINQNSGQSYGYVVYRMRQVDIPANSVLKIQGNVRDTVAVLINSKLVSKILDTQQDLNGFGYWRLINSVLYLGPESYQNATLDLLVENWGRVNYGKLNQFNQFKGLSKDILLNEKVLENFEVVPLEFRKNWTTTLTDWTQFSSAVGPTLYKSSLTVIGTPKDTYIDMRGWIKGLVIVNGFILGRYLKLGPQHCLYLPGVFLKEGPNSILIFEHFVARDELRFTADPVYELLQ